MKTVMFVLLSAATLLLQPHDARSNPVQPRDYLNHILSRAEDCNASLIENEFVEDVSPLTEVSTCGDKFFCKVEQILNKTHNVCKAQETLRKTLKNYHHHERKCADGELEGHHSLCINCTAALVGENTTNEMQVSSLLQKVKECVQRKNFAGKN
ncbi:hypothetical protein INR49_008976 [Caranx melampygus]|nr:hypothetical protein INR49_008976 [Caranx melampygus]